jgi:hypothetical protein
VRRQPGCSPDAEGDRALDLVCQLPELRARIVAHRAIRPDCRIPAGDVESDARDGDLLAVCGNATNRHDVPEVTIRHECDALGARSDVRQLGERLLVVDSENH